MDSSSRDDIDIQELAVRIIRYFRNHFTFIVVFCLVGAGLGVAAYKALPNSYESKMVVLSDLLTKTYGDRIDESLNSLISEGNISELSSRLAITPEKAAVMQSVSIECQLDVKTPQREKVEKDETYFIITVDLTDRSALPQIQEGMLNYLRNNEWVKLRARQRAQLSTAVIQRIDREIESLDSIKRTLFQKGQLRMEHIQFDPSDLYTETAELTRMRWLEQQDLELANSIHLIEGFTVFEKPKDPKLTTLVILGFLVGLLGSIGLLTLKHLLALARR
jgi:hypothetical protein